MSGDACARWLLAACALAHAQDMHHPIETEVNFVEGDYYEARCSGGSGAAAPLYPPRPMRFRRVTLFGCALPNATYAAALRAINVTVTEQLGLVQLPSDARITAASLAGLPASVDSLELKATAAGALVPHPAFLAPLDSLRSLWLERVRPDRLPPRLDILKIYDTGLEELPLQALAVVKLDVSEPQLKSVADSRTMKLRKCERLRELSLERLAAELPDAFAAECGALRALRLRRLRARLLPRGLLRNATQLALLELTDSALSSLPPDLFNYSPNLRHINLTNVRLESLPSGLFSGLESLERLTLAQNRLRALDLPAVANAASLQDLDLSDNPLGDLCFNAFGQETSELSGLSQLQQLKLARTNLTRVCGDWLRGLRPLRVLDLSHNAVLQLTCADLRVRRSVPHSYVDLSGNPLIRINCTQDDYERTEEDPIPAQMTKLVLDSQLECDCGAYWLARVLRDRDLPSLLEPRCAARADAAPAGDVTAGVIKANVSLRHAPLSALACTLPAALCAAHCACEHAPAAGGVRARCWRGPELPVDELDVRARSQGLRLVEMRAPGAGVRLVPPRLPSALQLLELDNNSISRASTNSVAELFAGGRRVRLTRNPLVCNCSNLPLLDALRAHQHLVIEYKNTLCADGRQIEMVTDTLMCHSVSGNSGPGPLGLVLATGSVLAGVLGAAALGRALARPDTRRRLRTRLHSRSRRVRCLRRPLEPPDVDRPFDVFVAHAQEDERFVAERLVARLEPERRMCLSYRDWPAGAWIPTQITESVRRSRRTLCVISQHSLRSQWARAELRAAHAHALQDATPRLLLLLLDVPAAALDAELRAAYAHLRWGEPCFWDKLASALPDPRPSPDSLSTVQST